MGILDWGAEMVTGALEIAEVVPGAGTLYHGAKSLYNSAEAGIDTVAGGTTDDAANHATKAGMEAVQAIPLVGSLLGLGLVSDIDGNDEEKVHEYLKHKIFGDTEVNEHPYRTVDPPPVEKYGYDPSHPPSVPTPNEQQRGADTERLYQSDMARYQDQMEAWKKAGSNPDARPPTPTYGGAADERDTMGGGLRLLGLKTGDYLSNALGGLLGQGK